MNRVAVLTLLLLLATAAPVGADEEPLRDRENPRNVRFTGALIDYTWGTPRTSVKPIGGELGWADGTETEWRASVKDVGVPPPILRFQAHRAIGWTADGRVLPYALMTKWMSSSSLTYELDYVLWEAVKGRHVIKAWTDSDACQVFTDALRVALYVKQGTMEAGDRRFGSFVRRFRKSLEDLNALLEQSRWPLAPDGIYDRFRIDSVSEVGGPHGRDVVPPMSPGAESDVLVVCDEGGPLAGFSLPEYVIGHSYTGPPEHHGLWSSWGEQTLWRELMHFRGVQDFSIYEVPDGGLPGRWKGVLPLPKRYAVDLMASPFQTPVIGEYAAVVANAKKGIARVGACEDTANPCGHMWNWLPGRIDLALAKDKRPLVGASVRWWRSRAVPDVKGSRDPRQQGVAAGRPPDGTATSDEVGRVSITGDYLGRGNPREDRSLWLLVEVESGGETRFEVLYGLDVNLAYARGSKYGWSPVLEFERLLVPNGTIPVDR